MSRQLISSGSTFEQEIGYSRAVVDGNWIFVSGTTGFDCSKMTISEDLVEQTEQCLKNILEALSSAGQVCKTWFGLPMCFLTPQIFPIAGRLYVSISVRLNPQQ